MNANKLSAACYLATLMAIVLLTVSGAIIVVTGDYGTEVNVAKIIGALAFITSAVTGLVGVIGTFRPKGDPAATTQSGDVNVGGKP